MVEAFKSLYRMRTASIQNIGDEVGAGIAFQMMVN